MSRAIAFLLACFLPAALRPADGPTFDVVSVKIAGPETQFPYIVTGGPGTSDPGRFHGPHMAMSEMLTASDPSGAPDVFTAIRKQLGLRLDKTADVPLDVIVVESVDRVPVEN